jgi:UDP-N-acetylglucosamine--N-acetylmuramyl-(pentapeptide) pyrophosphoryl-undecaprenol N-acetylglucosamine transferase
MKEEKAMRIVAAGGGSGGHVTPVLAVINELRKHDKNLQVTFVTDKKFGPQAMAIMSGAGSNVTVKKIYAGKWRRYHKVAWWRQMFDVMTMVKNLSDVVMTTLGFMQSFFLLIFKRPDVVFTKGGFVCMPIGMAAHLLRIPVVIHDSDAHPGLSSRILSRYAVSIATGSPVENYPYPKEKTHYVGIPVDSSFAPVDSAKKQQSLKATLGLSDTKKPLVVITGGGLGARNINRAVTTIAPRILQKVAIFHITGDTTHQETLENANSHADYIVKPFVAKNMSTVLGAADIVVARAGATTMQELAAMAKPCIIIPGSLLAAGHQLKNAAVYQKAKAAIVIDESRLVVNPTILENAIKKIIGDADLRSSLGRNMYKFARPEAAVDTAALVVEAASGKTQKSKDRG